ncbi:hypothetical protein H8356DRAFT_1737333 [Neocallimastix lanati (nom. inval.)]|nr:hypothetical protein H8356DRAFT_1737333 [Neocallimastix sp. JGI-2020a]
MSSIEEKRPEVEISETEKVESEDTKRSGPFDPSNLDYNKYQNMYYESGYPDQYQFAMPPVDPIQPVQLPPFYNNLPDAPLPPFNYPQQPQYPIPEQPYSMPMPTPSAPVENNYYPTQTEKPQSETQQQEIPQTEIPTYESQEKLQHEPVPPHLEQSPVQTPVQIPVSTTERDKFINKLKGLLKNVTKKEYPTLEEKFIELEIENWDQLKDLKYSPEYVIGDNKWRIKLFPNGNGENGKNHVSLYLENLTVKEDNLLHVAANYVLFLRNYNDYSEHLAYGSTLDYFNINNSSAGYDQFIDKLYLNNVNIETQKGLLEDNKIVVGAYVRVYKYIRKEQYIEEIKKALNEDNSDEVIADDIYEWRIDNWSELKDYEKSPEFISGGYRWRIKLFSKGFSPVFKDYISVYLNSVDAKNDETIHINAKAIFYIRNSNDFSCLKSTGEKISSLNYATKSRVWGSHCFAKRSELFRKSSNTNKSLIEDNKTVIGVFIRIYKYTQETFLETIKKLIDDENHEILKEDYHEWEVENWSKIENEENRAEFNAIDQTWQVQLFPNGYSDAFKDYVSIFMDNVDSSVDITNHLCIKRVFYIRNVNDYSIFGSETSKFTYYDKGCYSRGTGKLVKKDELYSKKGITNKTLIEDDKAVVGVYLRAYKYEEKQFIKEISELIDDGERETVGEDYFEWNIKNWDRLSNEILSSEFNIGGQKWRIKVYPNGNEQDAKDGYLTIGLRNESITNDDQFAYANFVVAVRNTNDYSCYKTRELLSFRRFTKAENEFDMIRYTPLTSLYEKNEYYGRSILEEGKITICAYIRVYNNNIEHEIEEKRKLNIPFVN